MDARPAAVAGRFYPGLADKLAALVDALLAAVPVPAGEPLADAYVVPHAGYRYSGPTAAQVYARLRGHAAEVRRVVIIGPAHYVPVAGCVATSRAAWATPLGEVPVDQSAVSALAERGQATVDDLPHEQEHSLEVQLPFLQRALPAGVPIVPLVVGESAADHLVVTLAAAAEPGTLVLCSTDLSHYLAEAAARRQDDRTAKAVLDLAPDRIGRRDACGVYALRGLVAWARDQRLRPRLLQICTSADATGDPSRVVGYAAFAFHRD